MDINLVFEHSIRSIDYAMVLTMPNDQYIFRDARYCIFLPLRRSSHSHGMV
jgi:hypothetical protein